HFSLVVQPHTKSTSAFLHFFLLMLRRPQISTLFPYTTLFRSRAGSAVALHDRGVPGRHVLGQRADARRGLDAGRLERVLHGARHAVQRPPPLAPRTGLVGGARSRERRVLDERDDGVEPRVVALDALDGAGGQLDRGHIAPPDGARDL